MVAGEDGAVGETRSDAGPRGITEDASPGHGEVLRRRPAKAAHPDNVRMWLALLMVAILACIVGVACWGWISGASLKDLQALALILSPVVTLVGTILGFYFSSEHPHRPH